MTKFERMGPSHPLIEQLKNNKPLLDLVKRKNFNLEIRKNRINIYYLMGNLLKITRTKNNKLKAYINYQFLPVKSNQSEVKLLINSDPFTIDIDQQDSVKLIKEDIFSNENFKIITKNIETYAGEEKGYQSDLIEKNKKTILDAEAAFKEDVGSENKTQMDLINYDKRLNAIVAIELKIIGDSRLYNGEIKKQLKRYSIFLNRHQEDIRKAYQNVAEIKKKLGLSLDKDIFIDEKTRIIPKPMLVVICHDQKTIDEHRNHLEEISKNETCALYMAGEEVDLNLLSKTKGNKIIYN